MIRICVYGLEKSKLTLLSHRSLKILGGSHGKELQCLRPTDTNLSVDQARWRIETNSNYRLWQVIRVIRSIAIRRCDTSLRRLVYV